MKRVNVYYDGDLYDEEEPDGEFVYFAEANAIYEAQAAQLQEAREAIQLLMDVQNGPPLVTYEPLWNEAMDRARAFLAKS
jgi:hypothetical protein